MTTADVRMPAIFGSQMVLQRDMPVPVWGWADAGEEVTVTFRDQSKSAKANADGKWTVVQQGMDPNRLQARRYHWLSEGLQSFVDEPHQGIAGPNLGEIVNLTDRRANASREAQIELVRGGTPAKLTLTIGTRP